MIKSKKSLRPIWRKSRACTLLLRYIHLNKGIMTIMANKRQNDIAYELRQKTGMGIFDCYKCLKDLNWNMEAALLKWRDYCTTINKPLINWRDQVK